MVKTSPGATAKVAETRAPLPPLPRASFLPPPPPSAVTVMDATPVGTFISTGPELLGAQVTDVPADGDPEHCAEACAAGAARAPTARRSIPAVAVLPIPVTRTYLSQSLRRCPRGGRILSVGRCSQERQADDPDSRR